MLSLFYDTLVRKGIFSCLSVTFKDFTGLRYTFSGVSETNDKKKRKKKRTDQTLITLVLIEIGPLIMCIYVEIVVVVVFVVV